MTESTAWSHCCYCCCYDNESSTIHNLLGEHRCKESIWCLFQWWKCLTNINMKDCKIKSWQSNGWGMQNDSWRQRSTWCLYATPYIWNVATLCSPLYGIHFCKGTDEGCHHTMGIVLSSVLLASKYVWYWINNWLAGVGMMEHSISCKRMLWSSQSICWAWVCLQTTYNERKAFLQKYGLETVSHLTIYHWMTTVLGFSYCISIGSIASIYINVYIRIFCSMYWLYQIPHVGTTTIFS